MKHEIQIEVNFDHKKSPDKFVWDKTAAKEIVCFNCKKVFKVL